MLEITRTLRRGSQGADVRLLQQLLTDLGFFTGPIDGFFGAATEQAVRAFQASRGIAVDGIVGPQTRAALATAVLPEQILPSEWVWLELEASPEATQARGVAIVHASLRQLHVSATGLPAPTTFGANYNTYRAWLLDAANQPVTSLRLDNCPTTNTWVGSGGTIINEDGVPASVIITPEANGAGLPVGEEVLGGELTEGIPVTPVSLDNTNSAADGTGFAFINQAQGLLAVFASGLPEPQELGSDPALQTAFNVFAVLLSNKHTGEHIFPGSLVRCLPGSWVGIFRLEQLMIDHIKIFAQVDMQVPPMSPIVVLKGHIVIHRKKRPFDPRPLG